jgi:GTP-binding protein
MLIDEITIQLRGGNGGKGAVAFQKVRLMHGPTGADGGRGGNVYLEGVSDIGALMNYASRKEMHAEDGKNGRGQFIDGRAGDDLVLKIPTGTTITNLDTGFVKEITRAGERILVAGGGVGGRGNFKFRSSTNTTPMEAEEGKVGDVANFKLELRLIADVGLLGLPNAGKSSLLNELTAAKSRVANYAFTTLEPNLGSYYGIIIADIPGLIEGASGGKGLGVKFLKHIERTKVLFHLLSAESDDVARDYATIRDELQKYNPLNASQNGASGEHSAGRNVLAELTKKTEYVFLTKADAVPPKELK